MRNKKSIFGILNLVLFLSSFSFVIGNTFKQSNDENPSDSFIHVKSKPASDFQGDNQQVSENNEIEDENDNNFEMASFTMPFLVSFEQLEINQSISHNLQVNTLFFKNAIYLAVHNLRI